MPDSGALHSYIMEVDEILICKFYKLFLGMTPLLC